MTLAAQSSIDFHQLYLSEEESDRTMAPCLHPYIIDQSFPLA
jgi:hypothetical protein